MSEEEDHGFSDLCIEDDDYYDWYYEPSEADEHEHDDSDEGHDQEDDSDEQPNYASEAAGYNMDRAYGHWDVREEEQEDEDQQNEIPEEYGYSGLCVGQPWTPEPSPGANDAGYPEDEDSEDEPPEDQGPMTYSSGLCVGQPLAQESSEADHAAVYPDDTDSGKDEEETGYYKCSDYFGDAYEFDDEAGHVPKVYGRSGLALAVTQSNLCLEYQESDDDGHAYVPDGRRHVRNTGVNRHGNHYRAYEDDYYYYNNKDEGNFGHF